MDKLPPEGRALVAEYYARLRQTDVADIDAKVKDFEMAVRDTVGPIIDNDNPESVAEAEDNLNTLRKFVQSIGAGVREHFLARLPAVALCLLFSCVYLPLEHFVRGGYLYIFQPHDNPTSVFSLGFLYSMTLQMAFCLFVFATALRVLWPTEGYRTKIVLATEHIQSYFTNSLFSRLDLIIDFIITGIFLYFLWWSALIIPCLINPFAWMLTNKIFNLLFNAAMFQFIGGLSLKMPFMWNAYLMLWDAGIDIIYTFTFYKIGWLVFMPLGVYFSVRWINRFLHLRWVRSRLNALEYRLYKLFGWLQRRGFLLID